MFFIVGGNIFIALAHHLYFQMTPALEAFPEHSIDVASYLGRTPFWTHSLDLFVIGPISEELIFREYLYRLFDKKWLAYFVSVTVFAWVHAGFTYSFFLYLPMSLIVTLAYHRRKAIGESIVLHSSIDLINTYLPNLLSFWVF
ncbi:CPBP family intramembrane metalloprotease [Lactococcus lactis subsp. lactis]|uniref:CPBP family intramembrane glutamic endopeptidase n=1 Tax=Lactococcus lactis TaxID=1358 RepID=UPI00300E0A76